MKYVFIAILFALISCKKKEDVSCVSKTYENVSNKDYIENDSASIFFGKNTVKFTMNTKITHQCASLPRDICENKLFIENLTDKQISVKIMQGLFNIGTIDALPKAKGDKSVSISAAPFGCTDISNFQATIIYK